MCQTEGKGIYTVPVQYRPSGTVAGPRIRKQDPWKLEGHGQYVPQRLPQPQGPGKHIIYCVWHIVCYDIVYDVVAQYRMF